MRLKISGVVAKNNIADNGVCWLDIVDEDDNCGVIHIGIPGANQLKKMDSVDIDLTADLRQYSKDGNNTTYLKVVDVNDIKVA